MSSIVYWQNPDFAQGCTASDQAR